MLGNGLRPEWHHRIRIVAGIARPQRRIFFAAPFEQRGLRVVARRHADVAAQGQCGEHVLRLAPTLAEQRGSEADRKARRVDTGELRRHEMAELVNEDHEAEDENRCDEC